MTGERAVVMRELKLPAAVAADDRLKLILFVVVQVGVVRVGRAGLTREQWPNIKAVDCVPGQLGADEPGDGRQQVDGHEHRVGGGTGRDLTGPSHDARHAHASFPASSFALTERPGGAGMIAVGEPGAIVGREDDQRVSLQSVGLECPKDARPPTRRSPGSRRHRGPAVDLPRYGSLTWSGTCGIECAR